MTNNDYKYDAESINEESSQNFLPVERILLLTSTLITVIGFSLYTVLHYNLFPPVSEITYSLAGSVLLVGIGMGAFSLVLNTLVNPVVTKMQAVKIGAVYAPVLGATTLFVAVGTFNTQLAILFLTFLCMSSMMYSLFVNPVNSNSIDNS